MSSLIRKVIRERRTIRSFIDKDIPTKLLVELLQDASFAPNHKHREPWSFILFRDEAKEKLSEAALKRVRESEKMKALTSEKQVEKINKMKNIYQQCPAHLIVLCDVSDNKKVYQEDYAATSAFIQNFQLLAWDHGIGMVWKTPLFIEDPSFFDELGINATKKIVGLLHIGYPLDIPKTRERSNIVEKLEIRK
ncbi:nitroreductase family protein [Sutcliffiella halmapala]|uniref:nitroreductase family protein n=1 Tax=Sutcliffiella halmapala TaxID=79882 RepID=UPI0009956E42|nr:nitroreductase [Sutcliffiella halmapala]